MLAFAEGDEIISMYGEDVEVVECAEGCCMQCKEVEQVVLLNSGHVLCEGCLLEGMREEAFGWGYLYSYVYEAFSKPK